MVINSLLSKKPPRQEVFSSRSSWRTYESVTKLSDIKKVNPVENKVLSRVYSLGEKLKDFDGIGRVRITAPNNWDLHWLEFEVEAKDSVHLAEDLWDKLQDLVIDLEWQLRDETEEAWHFHLAQVSSLTSLEIGVRLVWVSYLLSTSSKKIQSSFTEFKPAM